jgi:hypothetical protein
MDEKVGVDYNKQQTDSSCIINKYMRKKYFICIY